MQVEKGAVDYIQFTAGKIFSIKFDDFGVNKLKFRAIKYDFSGNATVEDLVANTQYILTLILEQLIKLFYLWQ